MLVKAECGICKHTWDIQALDAEMCDLIHGETFAVLSNVYGQQPQTLPISLRDVRSWGKE